MPGPVFVAGDPVALHTIEEEDVSFLQRNINDPRVRATLSAVDPVTAHQEREWVASNGEAGVHLLVCADGDPVGTVGISNPHEAWGVAEVGYWVVPEAWGNGYATAALELICGYAFGERRLGKLYADVLADNTASRRVAEKAGFREEGVLRGQAFVDGERADVVRYGRLATDAV